MSADRVEITSEVFWACSMHAMSTEVEEIMGLLLGDVVYADDGSSTVRIWAVMPQIRTDRRKDRVEASPEQMARCAAFAERFSQQSNTLTRVIGWYHSHPHITVLPSHVDVRTQASYQMLDRNFVGLIISAFNEDATSLTQSLEITAFQSVSASQEAPMQPGDSSDFEQAMAASAAAAQNSGDWVRKEVPLSIVLSHGEAEQTLTDIRGLLIMLLEEEKGAYEAAMADARDGAGEVDALTALQHTAAFQQHVASLVELVLGPALHTLRITATQTVLQTQQLESLEALLREALQSQADEPPVQGSLKPQQQQSQTADRAGSMPFAGSCDITAGLGRPSGSFPPRGASAESAAAVSQLLAASRLQSPTASQGSAAAAPQQQVPLQPPEQRGEGWVPAWAPSEHAAWAGGGPPRGATTAAGASGRAFPSEHDPFSDLGQLDEDGLSEDGFEPTCLDDYGRVVPRNQIQK
mmetsp:Transcript_1403/g.4182  ORF Transcript_1403/g.4182 Transcript_1403/m.4182 type:complete len:466 (+) Transcript_1403:277-1674(+)